MSLLGLGMTILFIAIVLVTFVYVLGWKGLMVAGCIPSANLIILVGRHYGMWTTSPFLPLWAMIVMYAVVYLCMMPVITGDYFA